MQQSPSVSPATSRNAGRVWRLAVIAGCATLIFLIFGQTVKHSFVTFDDGVYIYQNPIVSKGLTWEGLRWALGFGAVGHWHPLTWVLHMLNCQFFGQWAGGHHLVNVILHTASVVLLFLLLLQTTGAFWRAAFVAAIWGIHPLRVESVAWVAECKDVLAGLFFMIIVCAYVHAVRHPSLRNRVLVMFLFLLGLLSKNMLVTLPCVLLLLDYWPLNRRAPSLLPLIREKLPLFLLSAFSCVITVLVPEQIEPVNQLPLWLRLENAIVSAAVYIGRTFWPANLAVHYPNPTRGYPVDEVLGALFLIGGISAIAFQLRKQSPSLLVGWLWFLGMLVPTIGVVQISHYAHADRYTYLPQIGLLVAATWMVADATAHWRFRRQMFSLIALILLGATAVASFYQTRHWRNSVTLWTKAVQVNPGNAIAQNNLGAALRLDGQSAAAIPHYREAVRINPDYANARANLGRALLQEGQVEEALVHTQRALELQPGNPGLQTNLAWMLATAPKSTLRDGPKALQLVTSLILSGNRQDPNLLRILAAAYAETGEYAKADQVAQLALELAQANPPLAASLRTEIGIYQSGHPFPVQQ